jgi:hypothetical protein
MQRPCNPYADTRYQITPPWKTPPRRTWDSITMVCIAYAAHTPVPLIHRPQDPSRTRTRAGCRTVRLLHICLCIRYANVDIPLAHQQAKDAGKRGILITRIAIAHDDADIDIVPQITADDNACMTALDMRICKADANSQPPRVT